MELHASPRRVDKDYVGILVSLVNVSKDTQRVSRRILFNASDAPAEIRDVWVDVREKGGSPLELLCTVRAGKAGRADYVKVRPHESVGRLLDLTDCMRFEKGKAYELIAHWKDGGGGAQSAAQAFTDELVSSRIEFEN